MKRKRKVRTYEEIKLFFEEAGCKLLATEYHNVKETLRYQCTCGTISETCFDTFQRGHRCRECKRRKMAHSIQKVKAMFEDGGCTLLSETYVNDTTPLDYICQCGEKASKTFAALRDSAHCKKCGIEKSNIKKRRPLEEVTKIFQEAGCTLMSEEYYNPHLPLEYICKCGRESKISLKSFLHGSRCKKCAADLLKLSFEEVKEIFKDGGCILLSKDYENSASKLRYQCHCGAESIISLNKFQTGQRCKKCAVAKGKRKAFSRKQYKFPSGKEVLVQGYENHCIDQLLREGVDENDIIVEDIPTISYNWNGSRNYYPDIFVPSKNLLIEVKSHFIWNFQVFQNIQKMKHSEEQGYHMELRVYDGKGAEIYRRNRWKGVEPFLLDRSGTEEYIDDESKTENLKTDESETENLKTDEDDSETDENEPKPKRIKLSDASPDSDWDKFDFTE